MLRDGKSRRRSRDVASRKLRCARQSPTDWNVFGKKTIHLCWVLLLLAGCGRESDEERIRAVVRAAEQAVEERDTSDAMQLVSDDYADSQGFDKAQLQSYLRAYFLTHPKIELLVHTGDVEIETATRARARIEVAMVGARSNANGDSASFTADMQALNVDFRLQDSQWRVTRVDRIAK